MFSLTHFLRDAAAISLGASLGSTGPRGPPGVPYLIGGHTQMEVRVMRSKPANRPGPLGPDLAKEPLGLVPDTAPRVPVQKRSEPVQFHDTGSEQKVAMVGVNGWLGIMNSTTGPQTGGSGQYHVVRESAWTDASGLSVRLVVLGRPDGGMRRRCLQRLLSDAGAFAEAREDPDQDQDLDLGPGTGVRVPVGVPPGLLSGGAARVAVAVESV